LNIPPTAHPDFMIITDKNANTLGRQILASNIASLVQEKYPESKHTYLAYKDDEQPDIVQKKVEGIMEDSKSMVVILLSGPHNWRNGVYNPVEKEVRPGGKVIRFAYSPRLTAADSYILEQMDGSMQEKIEEAVESRCRWFKDKKSGELTIKTENNKEHVLTMSFDMSKATIIPSTGFLSDSHPKGNVPSGEAHLVPYLFTKSQGEVETTKGLVITVENGLAIHIDANNSHDLTKEEELLVDLVNQRSKEEEGIPLSKLGLGVLENLGIKRKEDEKNPDGQMSILTLEKLGIHMGFGVLAGISTEKKVIEDKLKKEKIHIDVLLSSICPPIWQPVRLPRPALYFKFRSGDFPQYINPPSDFETA